MTASTLEGVRSATRDVGALMDAMEDLERRFVEDRARDRVGNAIAVALLDAIRPNAPERATVRDYLEATTAVEQTRIELQQSALEYVYGIVEADAFEERIDSAVEAYDRQADARTALEAERGPVAIPPLVVLESITDRELPLGGAFVDEIGVQNAGDTPTTEVQVAVESTLPASRSPRTIDAIEPGERVSVSVSIQGVDPGRSWVSVAATTDETGDTIEFGLDVVPKREWIDRAATTLDRVLEGLPKEGGRPRDVERRLRSVRRRLQRLQRAVERGRRPVRAVDAELDGVGRQLATIASRLGSPPDTTAGGRAVDRTPALLARMVADARDDLDIATEAAIRSR